jgi:rubrerythrin
MPKGSSGSWIIGSKQGSTTVYGALAATDPLGSLWMVPMTDILGNIEAELNTGCLKLSNGIDTISSSDKLYNTGSTAKSTCTESTAGSTYTKSTARSTCSSQSDKPEVEERDSALSQSQHKYVSSKAYRRLTKIPSEAAYVPTRASSGPFHYVEEGKPSYSKINRKSEAVWFCGECGDGPSGAWQFSCPICGYNGDRYDG